MLDSPDLIEVDLKIWGDPYWLTDSGVGNYTAEQTEFINITKDGSADYPNLEIDCILNFRILDPHEMKALCNLMEKLCPTKAFSGL